MDLEEKFSDLKLSKMPKRKSDMKELVVVRKKVSKPRRKSNPIRRETKFFATAANSLAPLAITSTATYASSSSLVDLTSVGQGVDRDDRIGRSILVTGLQIRGVIRMDQAGIASTGQDYMAFRLIVAYDKEGGSATSTSVIETDTAAGATTQADFYGSRQMNQSERWKVLLDEYSPILPLQPYAGAGSNDAAWMFDRYLKLPNLKVSYSGSTATPVTGNIYLFFMNDIQSKAAGASQVSNMTYTARLHFIDP